MAEIMTQAEIDALMSEIDPNYNVPSQKKNLERTTSPTMFDDAVNEMEQTANKKTRIYSLKENKNKRIQFPYKSPVVRDYLLNPESEKGIPESVPVVRTIELYSRRNH